MTNGTEAVAKRVGEEQRAERFSLIEGTRRRWGMIAIGGVVLLLGHSSGFVRASLLTVGSAVGAASVLNLTISFVVSSGWRRSWLELALGFFDVGLASLFVVYLGPGGAVAAYLVVIIPYAFRQDRIFADVLMFASAIAYLGFARLHGWVFDNQRDVLWILDLRVYFDAALLIVIALALRRLPASLAKRLRLTRASVERSDAAALTERTAAQHADELGLLEGSLSNMLDRITKTLAQVQREADEVALFAALFAESSGRMLDSGEQIASTATVLAKEMDDQRLIAERGHGESTEAAQEADNLSIRAERIEESAERLVQAAEHGRDRVSRASETLLAIGADVRATAKTVEELSVLSKRIGVFAQSISKIARHTHILALNAAIEAARADEHGKGFAVVADQVRTLAADAGQSARDVADLIIELQNGIQNVAKSMTSGEEKVRDVGVVAGEASAALDDLHANVAQAADLVTATAGVSRQQAGRMASLAEKMSEVTTISSRSAGRADDAAAAMKSQIRAMSDLNQTSKQLAELAERLRASIAGF